MKIAVIGATGHLGGAVAQEATARGYQVTALNRGTVDAAAGPPAGEVLFPSDEEGPAATQTRKEA